MTYQTGEFLGYAVAWKASDGVVHLCDQARLLGEAEALLKAEQIKYPKLHHLLIEIHEAQQAPELLPEAPIAEVLQ